jgi:hypothetical protein
MIKMFSVFFLLSFQALVWSDSLVLFNNTDIQLSATILDANGKVLEETVINPQNSITWSLDFEYYGYDAEESNPATPYTVNWYCMGGELYGTCYDVSSDSTVLAQTCGGDQQCTTGD